MRPLLEKARPSINRNFSEALRTGLIFGAIETLTPLVGWGLGMLASQFVLNGTTGLPLCCWFFSAVEMVIEGYAAAIAMSAAPRRHGFWLLVTTAFATSLDAMAVGVGLAFLQVNIIATALAIGCATLMMSTLGIMVDVSSARCSANGGNPGGIVLIGIGAQILWSHSLS